MCIFLTIFIGLNTTFKIVYIHSRYVPRMRFFHLSNFIPRHEKKPSGCIKTAPVVQLLRKTCQTHFFKWIIREEISYERISNPEYDIP
jgi:hypothetical protein